MAKTMKALILGDIIGQPGLRALFMSIQSLIRDKRADLVIVNAENAAGGFGVTKEIAEDLFAKGVHVITTGNHVWQQDEVYPYLDSKKEILRPLNYPKGVPGHGSCELTVKGTPVLVVNVQGRRQMTPIDCPFQAMDKLLKQQKQKLVICDFHGEDVMEKEAFAYKFDGRLSVITGTHTHVQTADERILPKGSAYITDMGSCGPGESVIGFEPEISVKRFVTNVPHKNQVAETPSILHGIVCDIDVETGKTLVIERVKHQCLV